jgi:hypothetical protein
MGSILMPRMLATAIEWWRSSTRRKRIFIISPEMFSSMKSDTRESNRVRW